MNIIIITGASSGIGREFSIQLDKQLTNIDEFWLVARDVDRLNTLQASLKHKCRVFPIDLTKEAGLDLLNGKLAELSPKVRMLINSAGFGIKGCFYDSDMDKQCQMVRLNCEALTRISHMSIKYMRKNSRIIQLCSSAAFLPETNFAVYAATKAYVLSFSKALAYELIKYQIFVTCVCPGPVDTPFIKLADEGRELKGIRRLVLADPCKVVNKAIKDSFNKKLVSIYGISGKLLLASTKLFPDKLILEASSRFNKS